MLSVVDKQQDEFHDSVTLEPFARPFVLVPCGHSFNEDVARQLKECPQCRTQVERIIPNISLRQVCEVKGTSVTNQVYELFCVDISSSMWYSNLPGPLCFVGRTSRLDVAKLFIQELIKHRRKDESQKMGLFTFGTNINRVCELVSPIEMGGNIKGLTPSESRTRIYDAISDCCEHFKNSQYNLCEKRLYVLTDGNDNLSSEKNKAVFQEQLKDIKKWSGKLQIITIVFNVGGSANIDSTKKIADNLNASFKNVDEGNMHSLSEELCNVDFPNRAEQMSRLLLGAPSVPTTTTITAHSKEVGSASAPASAVRRTRASSRA